jgi:RNA polymerase sigma factor (sigma-70 family)
MRAFDKLAAKRFNNGVLAEEAVTHVLAALAEDDWARCRAFKGNAQPTTYLYSLASNLIEEFSRQRFGRPRPPRWLQEQGELWVQMWKMLCLERQLLTSVVDRLCINRAREPQMLYDVARTIKARLPNCGVTAMDHELRDDLELLSDAQQVDTDPEMAELPLEEGALGEVVLMLRSITAGEAAQEAFSRQSRDDAAACAERVAGELSNFSQKLSLSDEERLLLRMIFVEGFSKTAASKALGMASHQAGRIVNAALARIAQALQECGLSLEDLEGKV